MNAGRPILETSRLELREMTPGDLDFVAAMLAHPEVMRYYPKCYSRDEAAEWIDRQADRYVREGCGLWLAAERETGNPAGQVGLIRREVDGTRAPEVGYLIHRPYWRQGYATEAALACRDHAFHALDEPRVLALIRPENTPSQGVARKLGMQPGQHIMFHDLDHIVFFVDRE